MHLRLQLHDGRGFSVVDIQTLGGRMEVRRGPGWDALGEPEVTGCDSAEQAEERARELEKELDRKEKALAEAAALLVLKKKVQAIWGDADESTSGRRGS